MNINPTTQQQPIAHIVPTLAANFNVPTLAANFDRLFVDQRMQLLMRIAMQGNRGVTSPKAMGAGK